MVRRFGISESISDPSSTSATTKKNRTTADCYLSKCLRRSGLVLARVRVRAFVPDRDLSSVQDQILVSVLVGLLSFVQVLFHAFAPTQVRGVSFFQSRDLVFFHARVRVQVVPARVREPIRQFVFATLDTIRPVVVDRFVEFRNFLNDQDVGGISAEDQPDKIKKILCFIDGHDEILFDNINIFFEKYLAKIFL